MYLKRHLRFLISKSWNYLTLAGVIRSSFLKSYSIKCQNSSKMITLNEVISVLNKMAPLSLAESWDNVGLLVEPVILKPIENVYFTNDLTEEVLDEAEKTGANLIVSYHPPLFAPLKKITSQTWKERIIARCLANGIAVYSPHTSWDSASNGLTDWLISIFDGKITVIQPHMSSPNFNYVVNISSENSFAVQKFNGCLKDFLESQFISQINKEFKITNYGQNNVQILCTSTFLSLLNDMEILSEFDLHANKNETLPSSISGSGRFCQLKSSLTIGNVVTMIKEHLGVEKLMLALPKSKTLDSTIDSVATVAGSGASVLRGVKADLYLTGEMTHHDILDAVHKNVVVVLSNHSNSERGYLNVFVERFSKYLPHLKISISTTDKDPLILI
ncbi:NIF3-like protein 1 isoform X1 [Daktulosphaira vitifoliae]|uniref:NIF3-like protein 1 isoform X1 n=1 Tax=Daktulosphaira vitifoliae TaxID=58002 RepID=UPI0021A9DD53|nr:NIF3-like protein 1 isoform X1 [Daktulosphaira vitifoliae]